MTDAVEIAIIAATSPTVAALVAAWIGWLNRGTIRNVDANVDGRMTAMSNDLKNATAAILTLTGDGKYKDGWKDGKGDK
jgi:hypothetical protein